MSDKKHFRCLVTGGAGFIGSHVVEALLGAGHSVAVLDNLSTGKKGNLPGEVRIYPSDITGEIDEVFADFQPEVVIHHAAQVSVSVSVRDPVLDAEINVLGSLKVIGASLAHGVKKIVYASSGASYGPLETLPLRESMRTLPVSPYGISKHTVEHYLRAAGHEHGLEWVAMRYGNVYGPRQDPHGEAGAVSIFTSKILEGESPTIFDDGELTRDYVFVTDVARANVAAVETDFAGHADPIFNISTGTGTTVNSLFKELRAALEADVEARYGPPRPGDVRHSRLDPTRAAETLGWRYEVELVEGLKRTADFFRAKVEN